MTIFLGFVILFMMLITGAVLMYKRTSSVVHQPQEKVIVEREIIVNNPEYLTKAEAEIRFDKLDHQVLDLERNFKRWSYRSWLTAVVANENAHLAHEIDRRYHPQYQPDYLKMDREWKLNRNPEIQRFTEEQRRNVERGGFK